MKKIFSSIALALILSLASHAQTNIPQLINFQSVARDNNGSPIVSQSVLVRLTLREGSASGTALYCATHQATTNAYGSFSISLNRNALGTGCNGAAPTPFENLNWLSGSKWMQIEYQAPGGSFVDLGAAEMASSPFSLSSGTAEKVKGVELTGASQGQVLRFDANQLKWVPSTFTATDNQTLSLNGSQLSISNGNSVTLPAAAQSDWTNTSGNIYNNNNGSVGIGTVPSSNFKLDVTGSSRFKLSGGSVFSQLDGNSFFLRDLNTSANRLSLTTDGKDAFSAYYNGNPVVDLGRSITTNSGYLDLRNNFNQFTTRMLVSATNAAGRIDLYEGSTPTVLISNTTLSGGFLQTNGPNGLPNIRLSSLNGYPNNGFLSIANDVGTSKVAIYVDASGQGTVTGDVKNFRMEHPTDPEKEIWYASVEGPEAGAYVRGTATLINGEVTITFDEHFQLVGNSQTMTVSLTPLSEDSKGLAVVEKTATGFTVKELMKGKGNYSFDWEAKAVRKGYESYRVVRDKKEFQQTEVAPLKEETK